MILKIADLSESAFGQISFWKLFSWMTKPLSGADPKATPLKPTSNVPLSLDFILFLIKEKWAQKFFRF